MASDAAVRPVRIAVLAATAGFLLATALALWTVQTRPGWLRIGTPTTQAPRR